MAKDNEDHLDLIMKGGLIVAAYLVIVKPLVGMFGANDDEKQDVKEIDETSPSDNPFSAQYSPMLTKYQNQFNSIGGESAWFKALKYEYDNTDNHVYDGTNADIAIMAEIIDAAMGMFIVDNEKILAVFSTVKDKVDVSLIAGYLLYNYDKDLWNFLRTGRQLFSFIDAGMPISKLALIKNRVDSLPDLTY
jgi:hypothetical protein